jgi:ELWxxDGT repeat protein
MKKAYVTLCLLTLAMQSITAQSFTGIDIWPGTGGSGPAGMTAFNGKVYFAAASDTTATGRELWVTDGTEAGTMILKDIWPGAGSSDPTGFTVMGNQLFFSANDSIHGQELWVTDGTPAGTVLAADIWAGPGGSDPYYFTAYNGQLYFAAFDSLHGSELWVSNGTPAGTSLVKDIYPGMNSSGPFGLISSTEGSFYIYTFNIFNNKMYFRANDGAHGTELWVSDGTTAGTNMVADIWPGPGSSNPYYMTPINNMIIFGAQDSIDGYQLWTSDGTSTGTSVLKIINPNSNGSGSDLGDNSGFMAYNGKLYFTANQAATGYEMWVTDGTTAGTTLVADAWPGPGSSYAGYDGIGILNDTMYFSAADSINGYQLWTSDGTAAGTALLKVLSSYTPYNSYPYDFINYNGSLVFTASTDTISLEQLYISGGTSAGTHVLSPAIAPNANPMGSSPSFCVYNNLLLMNGNFNSIGDELWVYGFPTGIISVSGDNTISAYPNPFSASVTLSGLDAGGQYNIQVTDMTGRQCYSAQVSNPAQNISVSMPDLPSGIYLMRVSGNDKAQTFKLTRN